VNGICSGWCAVAGLGVSGSDSAVALSDCSVFLMVSSVQELFIHVFL
jgi:hypothetical protein